MDNFYNNLSARRRSALEDLIGELALISSVKASAANEFPLLLGAVREFELEWRDHRMNAPHTPRTAFFDDQPGYVADWTHAFFAVLDEWHMEVEDYRDATSKFENFRQSLPVLDPELNAKLQDTGLSLEGTLMELHEHGFDASTLGAAEAHFQLRRLAQLFFARYSAETALPDRSHPIYSPRQNPPRPNLAGYMYKKSRRAALMRQAHATPDLWRIDDSVFLALYIDRLDDGRFVLPSWHNKTRPLYSDAHLLLPGFPEIDAMLAETRANHGDFTTALSRLSMEPGDWLSHAAQDGVNFRKFGQLQRMLANIAAQKELVELRLRPSLCVMSMAHGRSHASYYSVEEQWLRHNILRHVALPPIHDIYQQGEIDWNWNPLLKKWKREAAKTATAKPVLKPVAVKPAHAAPVEKVMPPLTEKQKQNAAKKLLKKRRRKQMPAPHKAKAALRAAERAVAKRAEREREKAAARKAEKTRLRKKLDNARKAEERRQKREQAQKAGAEVVVPRLRLGMPKTAARVSPVRIDWQKAENEQRLALRKATREFRKTRNKLGHKPS